MGKLISVVVPHFPSDERRKIFFKCLEALVDQTLSNNLYEIIIVIDGFNQMLVDKIRIVNSNILVMSKEHTGACQTRNLGINFSKSKYK